MEFNKTTASFSKEGHFTDSMKRFVSEEAAFLYPEKEEAASSAFDKTAKKGFRFSASKSKSKAKEQKKILDDLLNEKDVSDSQEISPGKEKSVDGSGEADFKSEKEEDSKFSDEEKSSSKDKAAKEGRSEKEQNAKKEKDKETKKAAAKTAVANFLKSKADMGNELVGNKTTGDALKDGNTGLVKTFTTLINPMTYLKMALAELGAFLAPYILIFISAAAVILIIVALLFSVLQPLAEVGEALNSFIEFFTGEDGGIRNTSMTEDEIDEIVAASGATADQETVIRYALSKVGYPYSQSNRTSGTAYDCSSLAYYSWKEDGVDISYGANYPPSAAEGARMLEADGKKLSTYDLQPGDLIYYGGKTNGRYMGIYHVAIYVGNGMAVEALNETYGVVYQKLRTDNACMVCRPNL